MSSNDSLPVLPTISGVTIESTADALKIVQGCAKEYFQCVPRRPLDNERSELIKSGNVFVYEENGSKIKRWTDSVRWSPSRAMTNLLVYREVFDKFKPGERKVIRSAARNQRLQPYAPSRLSPQEQGDQSTVSLDSPPGLNLCSEVPQINPMLQALRPEERKAVVGSLLGSYHFKEDGLCKKTLAVNLDQLRYHIVAYFKISDVLNKVLKRPEEVFPQLRDLDISDLISQNPRYKHNIEASGRYDKDGQPLYDDDRGDRNDDLDISGYGSPSSDVGADITRALESPPERQLPPPLPPYYGGGPRHQLPNQEMLDISFGPHNYPQQSINSQSQHLEQQQQSLSFLQQQHNHHNQAFPPLQQHLQFHPLQESLPLHQSQQPMPADNNLFALYPQTSQFFPQLMASNEQSRSMPPSNEQPRSMANENSSFAIDPTIQFRRPTNMEPTIPHFSSNTELKNYQFTKKRDENESTHRSSSLRQPVVPQPLSASEPRFSEPWSGGMMDSFPNEDFDWEG